MLRDIDTGMEGKFDFPRRAAPPAIIYMLASVPRSGSSHLSHLLWASGCLGAPLEYLNYDGPYAFAAHSPELQHGLWRSALQRRTSPNGVFGFKCFPSQLQALDETNRALLGEVMTAVMAGRSPRIVHLARRDRVAHMVSYARAMLTGISRKEEEGDGVVVPYSEAALATAGHWIDSLSDAWEQMFRDLAVEPLRLWHEDVVADPGETVRKVADYLGVAIDPGAAVAVPAVLKQAEGDSRAWRERFAGKA